MSKRHQHRRNPVRRRLIEGLRLGRLVLALAAPGVAAAPTAPYSLAHAMSPDGFGNTSTACEFNQKESVFLQYLTGPYQKRSELSCEPRLQAYARNRARDMARRGYLSHITPDRKGPNRMLREAGYPLPDSYLNGLANNVESIVGGIDSPAAVWQALLQSPDHRPHLIGEDAGFLSQDEFGLAYYRDIYAPHVDYWVVIIARRPRIGDPELICTPAPSVCFRTGTVSSEAVAGTTGSGQGIASPR